MGSRGYNAGGFAWMARVACPLCGARRPLGHDRIRRGQDDPTLLHCPDRAKCAARRKRNGTDGEFVAGVSICDHCTHEIPLAEAQDCACGGVFCNNCVVPEEHECEAQGLH
jgi:hypothetical protein